MCKLHEKECNIYFDESSLKAFGELKVEFVFAPIIISSDWSKSFEVMCDSSRVPLCMVLG